MYVSRDIEARSFVHCGSGKAISITCSDCVFVALVFWNAIHMHSIVLSPMACVALRHFSTLSHKWRDFREKVMERKMCFDLLCKIGLKYFATTN